MCRLILIFIMSALFPFISAAQEGGSSTKSFTGDASVFTNYVWHGFTQTKNNPAIQTSLYYNLGSNLRIGAWGSNVSYYTSNKANALLRLQADIDLEFTPNFGLIVHYSDNRYFESDDRDGNTFGLEFNVFDWIFLIETESNFQGTTTKSRYHAVGKTFDVFNGWKWENRLGYTTFESISPSYYVDFKTGIGISTGPVFWQVALTGTDNNEQWGDAADYFITLGATASF